MAEHKVTRARPWQMLLVMTSLVGLHTAWQQPRS
jgi:hypothetical protein